MEPTTADVSRPVALVTGGSRGIGAAVAKTLASSGYDLLVTYSVRSKAAEDVAETCRLSGASVVTVGVDLGETDSVTTLFADLDQQFGRLDLLVNNAGILPEASRVADMRTARTIHTFSVNTVAPLLCAREAVSRMTTARGGHGGVIINVSSRAAVRGGAGEFVDYAMSKAAIDALTIGLAAEVANEGIRVNGVRPGLINTEMNTSAGRPDRLERLMSTVPLGRAGTAEDVAEAVRWLSSTAADYITGVTIDVSGGR